MFLKLTKIAVLLTLVFAVLAVLIAAGDSKNTPAKDENDADTKKIELIISNIININDANTALFRKTVNSDPEKYLGILRKLDGRFSTKINRLIMKFARGLEKYLLFKDYIAEIGTIIDFDFKESQLVILKYKGQSKLGWLMQKQLADQKKIRFLNNNLEYNEYLTEDVDVKLLDFRSIATDEAGKALGSKKVDTIDEASVLAVWAYAGMCKENYITVGLAIDACEKVLSRAFKPKNQTQPKDFDWSQHRKQQLLREIANNKLEQIYHSVKFNKSFEFRHKAVGKLNDAYSAKSELKTKISKLFEQFEKTKKFLDDTSSETEKNKPINKLLRAIINITEYFSSTISLRGSSIIECFPINYNSQEIDGMSEIWDIYGDFLPEKHEKITELLDCQLLTGFMHSSRNNDFLSVADIVAHMYFIRLQYAFYIAEDGNYKTQENIDAINQFFTKMPKKRSDFYVALHDSNPELSSFAVSELAQTHYESAKELMLKQSNEKIVISNLIRQFAVFLDKTDKDNFDK
ncbi:MAG: hypothetical protein KAR20_21050, partial [Candidatus Heimdallarchaeota archaeon]|nr:hypothetical protein [Candidatus Heimdallarchaeota archaeon]